MPSCTTRHLCDNDDCEIFFDRSFASHPKAIYWSDANIKKPREVFKQSNVKYTFNCSTCNHNFDISLNNLVCHNRWCPYCSNTKLCDSDACQACYDKSFASHPKSIHWSDQNEKKP